MLGMLFGGLTAAGSRAISLALSISLWLISRPGGWAVLVALALLALRWFPEGSAVTLP